MSLSSLQLDLTIYNDLIGLDEHIKVSKLNKYYKKQANKYIKKYHDLILKIEKINLISNTHSLYDININSNNYNTQYWVDLFGKNLNQDELALYYVWFIINYECSQKISHYKKTWQCNSYSDGFIKTLPSKNDGSLSFTGGYTHNIIRFIVETKYETHYQVGTISNIHNTNIITFNDEHNNIVYCLPKYKLIDFDIDYSNQRHNKVKKIININKSLLKKCFMYIKNNNIKNISEIISYDE
jgi:hypothetical protein